MKLKVLKNMIDQAVIAAGDTDPDVEVYHGEVAFDIVKVKQFNIVPDVVLTLKKKSKTV